MKKKLLFKWSIWFMLAFIIHFVYQGVTLAGITGKISGVVKDTKTDAPLPGVNIVIEETNLGAATDPDGNYFIINIPPGTYSLKASVIGYEGITKTGVMVSVDHNTIIGFDLKETAIAGQEVTVIAEREIIPMDISASQIVADIAEIVEVPLVASLSDFISLQSGIEGLTIRGGGEDQIDFMTDGLMVVDNRSNRPMMMVNLSAVKELDIIKGGFNAEYGNVRSGLINVITREGSPSAYRGSADIRRRNAGLKHGGPSMFNWDNFWLRPYLDPAVCYVGTTAWDKETQELYPSFGGWNAYSKKILADADPTNNRTPEECRELFMWDHRVEGSAALGQREGKYGDKPDWNIDAGFGGPVPVIGKYLGKLSFYASFRNNRDAFVFPVSRPFYVEQNSSLKLTSRITPSIKLTLEGLYGDIQTVATSYRGGGDNLYASDGMDLLSSDMTGQSGEHMIFYSPPALRPFNIYSSMVGLTFDHVLSPRTFYNIRIANTRTQNYCAPYGLDDMRDMTIVRYFGSTPVTEQPYGFLIGTNVLYMEDGMSYGMEGGGARDYGQANTINVKFDLTSQIDRYNQIKTGFDFNYDRLRSYYESIRYESPWPRDNRGDWIHFPLRGGAYVQDKLEFEGMITNFGVRFDYNDPNTDWYTIDRYSKYFRDEYVDTFTQVAPTEPTKGHLKVSPRLGISHPISENAKLYFNYGHFYSMPSSSDMYTIYYEGTGSGVGRIGNPNADLPKTVSYELGWEYNVSNMLLFHLAGYYKDVSDQTGDVGYISFDKTVDYTTIENNNWEDIRGFELRVDKRFGQWITGWINYNYSVSTSGLIGRLQYYEDMRLQTIYGLQNPADNMSVPLARPYFRGNIRLRIPTNRGLAIAGIKPLSDFQANLLFSWKAGSYTTWDPLNTGKLRSNLQWKDSYSWDARLSKRIQLRKYNFTLYMDIDNLFNKLTISTRGFRNSEDQRNYYESLHLPMYAGAEYQSAGYIAGNDKPGDVKSDEKPYINMPDRNYLTYFGMRTIFFGLRIDL